MNPVIKGNLEINNEEGCVLISINPRIYPLDVVLSAAYAFLDENYVLVDGDPTEELVVEIRPKTNTNLEDRAREFNNELVEYANHAVLALKQSKVREAILGHALNKETAEKKPPWSIDE
jgi:His-Xaa-Ser system protein HxsD